MKHDIKSRYALISDGPDVIFLTSADADVYADTEIWASDTDIL